MSYKDILNVKRIPLPLFGIYIRPKQGHVLHPEPARKCNPIGVVDELKRIV